MAWYDNILGTGSNIFGATPPSYFQKLDGVQGLLNDDEMNKLNQRSFGQGLLNTALTYFAQPKTLGAGSALPYLAKAGLSGVNAAQNVYDQATQDYMTQAKINEIKKSSEDEKARQDIINQLALTPEFANSPQKLAALKIAPKEFLMEQIKGGGTLFGKIDPKDYTAESISTFDKTKNYADLVPLAKAESSMFGKIDPKDYTKSSIAKFMVSKNPSDLDPVVNQNEGKNFEKANTLRNQFQQLPEVKSWNVTQPILLSAREASKDTSGASDLNLIYALGKALDPNSVVREGELQLAAGTGSLGEKLKGYYKAASTGGKLTPDVKSDLLRQIESRTYAQKKQYESAKKQYSAVATKYNIDPNELFIEPIVEPIDITTDRNINTISLTPEGNAVFQKYNVNKNFGK